MAGSLDTSFAAKELASKVSYSAIFALYWDRRSVKVGVVIGDVAVLVVVVVDAVVVAAGRHFGSIEIEPGAGATTSSLPLHGLYVRISCPLEGGWASYI